MKHFAALVMIAVGGLIAGNAMAQTVTLPPASEYRGEIRRGADGKLSAVPGDAMAVEHQGQRKATMVVGVGERIESVSEAARVARDGDIIEIKSGEYHHQVAIWNQDNLVIRGIGKRPIMIADGASAEEKAIWVVRGKNITVENVEFRGARVRDGNGAGIRFERGQLNLRRCAFFDNEMGILTGNDGAAVLEIADSEFGMAPLHAGSLHHLLYVGAIARFTLTGSRIQSGYLGHLVKSRARENVVSYNMLVDGDSGRASYELEFPNGGIAYVIGNVIGQSRHTDNQAIVAYGAEGPRWKNNALYLIHNTLINDAYDATYLRAWAEKFPPGAEIWALNNLTVGKGTFAPTAQGRFEGNTAVEKSEMISTEGIPLRLPNSHPLRGVVRLPGTVGGVDLAPNAEFTFPVGTKPIVLTTRLAPGAFQ